MSHRRGQRARPKTRNQSRAPYGASPGNPIADALVRKQDRDRVDAIRKAGISVNAHDGTLLSLAIRQAQGKLATRPISQTEPEPGPGPEPIICTRCGQPLKSAEYPDAVWTGNGPTCHGYCPIAEPRVTLPCARCGRILQWPDFRWDWNGNPGSHGVPLCRGLFCPCSETWPHPIRRARLREITIPGSRQSGSSVVLHYSKWLTPDRAVIRAIFRKLDPVVIRTVSGGRAAVWLRPEIMRAIRPCLDLDSRRALRTYGAFGSIRGPVIIDELSDAGLFRETGNTHHVYMTDADGRIGYQMAWSLAHHAGTCLHGVISHRVSIPDAWTAVRGRIIPYDETEWSVTSCSPVSERDRDREYYRDRERSWFQVAGRRERRAA